MLLPIALSPLCGALPEGALRIIPQSLRDSSLYTREPFRVVEGANPYRFMPQDNEYVTRLHAGSLTRLCRELPPGGSLYYREELLACGLGFATLPRPYGLYLINTLCCVQQERREEILACGLGHLEGKR